MTEIDDGTDLEQPADDIRSSLAAAIAESEAPDAVADGTAIADGTGEPKPERVRGPDGKFLKKEEGDADPIVAKPETAVIDPNAPAATSDSKEPPAHWSQADKDKFKAQAPETQSFILERFKAMEGDYTRKTQDIANFKKEYGPVDEMFAPHKDVLRQKGFSPRTLIEAWANVETKLAGGSDSAVDVIKGLVSGYNIPVDKLAAALGITRAQAAEIKDSQQPAAVENGQPVALPPAVERELQQLRERVGNFDQKFQTIEQREATARRAQEFQQEQDAEDQVNQFKSAVDEKGNLKHPHFADVEELMTVLANGKLASKQPVPPLSELYETAVHAHPDVRQKVLTAQRQQEEARRTEEARVKAASARRAGSSVTGAPGPGQAPNGKSNDGLSLREQLEAAAEDAA